VHPYRKRPPRKSAKAAADSGKPTLGARLARWLVGSSVELLSDYGLKRLITRPTPAIMGQLLAELIHPDPKIWRGAAETLFRGMNPAGVYLSGLDRERISEAFRQLLTAQLEAVGTKHHLQRALDDLLPGSTWGYASVGSFLAGELGDDDVVAPLCRALRATKPAQAPVVIQALGKLGGQVAVDEIVDYLVEHRSGVFGPDLQESAEEAFERNPSESLATLRDLLCGRRELGDANGRPYWVTNAIEGLVETNGVTGVVDLLEHHSEWARGFALRMVRKHGDPMVHRKQLRQLLGDQDKTIRLDAAAELCELGDVPSVAPICAAMVSARTQSRLDLARFTQRLRTLGSSEAIPTLRSFLDDACLQSEDASFGAVLRAVQGWEAEDKPFMTPQRRKKLRAAEQTQEALERSPDFGTTYSDDVAKVRASIVEAIEALSMVS